MLRTANTILKARNVKSANLGTLVTLQGALKTTASEAKEATLKMKVDILLKVGRVKLQGRAFLIVKLLSRAFLKKVLILKMKSIADLFQVTADHTVVAAIVFVTITVRAVATPLADVW